MRFLSSPLFEQYEAASLPFQFGKHFEPGSWPDLHPGSVLTTEGSELLDVAGRRLAIHPDTASWSFLEDSEAALFGSLHGRRYDEIAAAWPTEHADRAQAFTGLLYQRGLLQVDGRSVVDEDVFRDSANVPDVHLIELLLTERCNLGCTYCLAGTNARMPRMTPETAHRAVDLAFAMTEAEVLAFEFAGGEPFLEFGLMRDLAAYIQHHPQREGREIALNAQTNGTLLDEERVRWVVDNDVHLGLSLDGDPISQNLSRPKLGGGESFTDLRHGLDLLQRAGVGFGALVVLNRSNVGSVQRLADFLVDNGISGFKLNPVAFLGTARHTWGDVGITQEEVVDYFQELMSLIVAQRYPLLEDNVRTMCQFILSKRRPTRCLRSHCGAGDTFQSVSAAGDVYPCGRATQSPGLKLGHVEDGWTSLSEPGRRSLVIAEIRERRPDGLDDCSTCSYRQLCQSGCSAQAWERYGTVRHKTPECHFYLSMYPWLMEWLSRDLDAVRHLESMQYFGGGVELFDHDLLRLEPVLAGGVG